MRKVSCSLTNIAIPVKSSLYYLLSIVLIPLTNASSPVDEYCMSAHAISLSDVEFRSTSARLSVEPCGSHPR